MIDEFESNDMSGRIGQNYPNQISVGNTNTLETISDVSSLASWSKHLLRDERHGGEAPIVKPVDSISTKAAPIVSEIVAQSAADDSTDDARQIIWTSQSVSVVGPSNVSTTTAAPSGYNPTSGQLFGLNFTAPLPYHVSSLPSSVNHSSGSSKSSTMERFLTPESKTSSLDRRAAAGVNNIVRCLNKKSSSLNREVGGLSACEQLLYDNAHLAALERKNSAAAELIENLTSEFVKNSKLEHNSLQKNNEPLSAPVLSSNEARSSPLSMSKEKSIVASSSNIRAPGGIKIEPDIVSSNRVKEDAILENKTNFFIESPPSKPPRRKRLGKDNTLPLHSPPNFLKSSTISAPTSSKSSQESTLNYEKRRFFKAKVAKNQFFLECRPKPHQEALKRAITNLSVRHSDTLRPSLIKRSDAMDQTIDDNLPKCDPLSLHMLRLTNDLNRFMHHLRYWFRYRKMIGRSFGCAIDKTVRKMRNVTEGVRYRFHTDETNQSDDDDNSDNSKFIRGSVWCLKFSHCGRLLATGGQDNLIRVWILKDAFNYFNEMRSRYNADDSVPLYEQLQKCTVGLSSATNAVDSCRSSLSGDMFSLDMASTTSSIGQDDSSSPFVSKPFCVYRGHSADVLDLSWSKVVL
uniref:WD repeat-containing protein 44 n=1 Tax=Romanomermis culicivorax TaxID=13658 RepID=A0A915KZZ7_ROMCU